VICTECKHLLVEAGRKRVIETPEVRRDEYVCITCGARYRVSIMMLQRSTLSTAEVHRLTNRNT
jgi:RNase P subunit RPR2